MNEPSREDRRDEAVASFLQALDAGLRPDPAEWLRRYPDVADELTAFFAGQEKVKQVAGTPPMQPTLRYFGDYELLEEVARGGMSVVSKARQTSLNRVVAQRPRRGLDRDRRHRPALGHAVAQAVPVAGPGEGVVPGRVRSCFALCWGAASLAALDSYLSSHLPGGVPNQ